MENIILLKRDELNELIYNQVKAVIEDVSQKPKELLTEVEVKAYLGVSHATLYHWAKEGKLIPLKMGRKSRWLRSDIESFLQRKEA